MPWPRSADDFLALSHQQRTDVLLDALVDASEGQRGKNLLKSAITDWFPELIGLAPPPAGGFEPVQTKRHQAEDALEDAFAALMARGDIRAAQHGRTFCEITAQGKQRLASASLPNARRVTFAVGALVVVELHKALRVRGIDDLFRQGKFETALRDGATFLEDAIRTLGGYTSKEVGVGLCNKAFSSTGTLRDTTIHPAEADGWQQSFAGFFGVVRNRVGHRDFQYPSDKEALQHLMQLDRLTERLAELAALNGNQLT